MKGGFYGLRGRQISLILLALVCTTLVIWACEKTPLLSSILPPQSGLVQLSPELLIDASTGNAVASESQIAFVVGKATENELQESPSDVPVKKSPAESHVENGKSKTNVIKTPSEKKEDIYMAGEMETAHQKEKKPLDAATATSPAKDHPFIKERKKAMHTNVPKAEDQLKESVTARAGSMNITSFVKKKENENLSSAGKKACNYAIGKWVIDDSRPLYSGSGCKQWLSGMWACRLTQRTDFAYEQLRWRPKNCQMEEFTGSKFLERMRNKTLAFVGDSLGRQQFQSLMCMITGGEQMLDVLDIGWEYGLVKARGAVRPDGWGYRFPSTNTTILYYWSASLCDLEPLDPTNPLTEYAMHLDRPPAFLQHFINRFHVLVLNTGHHWNRGKLKANRWVMHVRGSPNIDRKIADIGGAKNLTVYSIVNWVNSQLPKYRGMKAFYRSISPRHFFNGDWNTGGTCDNTTPLSGGKEVSKDESEDPLAAGAVKGTKVKLLDITAISQLRDEGHISRYSIKATPGMEDCLHWCLPGVPDTWNEILFAQL